MIYETAYDTTVCQGFLTKPIQNALIELNIISRRSGEVNDYITYPHNGIMMVIGDTGLAKDIPQFSHPMLISNAKTKLLAIDGRTCTKINYDVPDNEKLTFNNKPLYEMLITRALLNKMWIDYGTGYLLSVNDSAILSYVRWISDAICKRYALNYRDEAIIQAIASIFYLSLFKNIVKWDEDVKLDILAKLSNVFRGQMKFIEEILLSIDKPMVNVIDLVNEIKVKTDTTRLKDFNHGVLYTVISKSWFGFDQNELLGIALEHPPTWLSILYKALSERLYRNTGLTKIVERAFKNKGSQFKNEIDNLIGIMNTDME